MPAQTMAACQRPELPLRSASDSASDLVARRGRLRAERKRQYHRSMLLVASLIVLLAFTLNVSGGERVALFGMLLPPSCIAREYLGVDCPGCGLTRSYILLFQGDWEGAWHMHRLGWLLALATVAQFPYRFAALKWPHREPLGTWFPRLCGIVLFGALIANWLLKQFYC